MAVSEATSTSDPVGKSVRRVDVFDKLTGAATFTDDIQFGPNLYHARLARSPHAHALIKRIDTSKALEVPGVSPDSSRNGTAGTSMWMSIRSNSGPEILDMYRSICGTVQWHVRRASLR